MRHGAADADKHHLDVAGDNVGQRRRRALVVDGLELGAGQRLEQFHVEVAAGADAERAVVDLAGLLLGERDQVLDVLDGQRRVRNQRVVDGDEADDRA